MVWCVCYSSLEMVDWSLYKLGSDILELCADDCLLVINSQIDATILQQELYRPSQWAQMWQLRFGISKCRCTRSLSPITHKYQPNKTS